MLAEDTEIPQLQEHARSLTKDHRISTYRRFLSELMQRLNSIQFWAFNDGIMTLPESEKPKEAFHLRQLIGALGTVRKSNGLPPCHPLTMGLH